MPRLVRSPRRGFILAYTILVTVLVIVVFVGVARRSLSRATLAAQAELDLQRRWGAYSCEQSFLQHAESWLSQDASSGVLDGQTAHRRFVVSLGSVTFDLLLADENAKVNVNQLQRVTPTSQLSQQINLLAQSPEPVQVHLVPMSLPTALLPDTNTEDNGEKEEDSLQSWGQVLPLQQFQPPGDLPRRLANATREMTCWGNGKLNVWRASAVALRVACDHVGTPQLTSKLMKARKTQSTQQVTLDEIGLEPLLTSMTLRQDDLEALRAVLTDTSHTYSLWSRATYGQRQTATLTVVEVPEVTEEEEAVDAVSPIPVTIARFAW